MKRANAHFSDDLLATLLNEPLVGHGVFWSVGAGGGAPGATRHLGPEGSGWRTETRTHPDKPGSSQTWVFLTETVEEIEHAAPPEEQE